MSAVETLPGQILETMHNEHCSYKSTRRILAGMYTEGPAVIQGPGENAGILRLVPGHALALGMESHNLLLKLTNFLEQPPELVELLETFLPWGLDRLFD